MGFGEFCTDSENAMFIKLIDHNKNMPKHQRTRNNACINISSNPKVISVKPICKTIDTNLWKELYYFARGNGETNLHKPESMTHIVITLLRMVPYSIHNVIFITQALLTL